MLVNCYISTHALTWSATAPACCLIQRPSISTHALTWSATHFYCSSLLQFQFQLTHSRGVRLPLVAVVALVADFNSRTHVECDERKMVSRTASFDFNSRTHVECDHYMNTLVHLHAISTHALTWSATTVDTLTTIRELKFQLTHSRGVRPRRL